MAAAASSPPSATIESDAPLTATSATIVNSLHVEQLVIRRFYLSRFDSHHGPYVRFLRRIWRVTIARELTVEHRFVAYYRMSARKQGHSGLGLEAQRAAVANHLGDGQQDIIAEFTEVESRRRNDRPALDEALSTARLHQAALVVAKVDRLTRPVGFLERLLEAGVDVCFADLRAIDGPHRALHASTDGGSR